MIEAKDSPKLKEVMAKIKQILDEEDIAGFVVLHEPGAGEFLLKIDPTYSSAKFEENLNGEIEGIKIEVTPEVIPEKEDRTLALEATLNMFQILTTIMGVHTSHLIDITDDLEETIRENGLTVDYRILDDEEFDTSFL